MKLGLKSYTITVISIILVSSISLFKTIEETSWSNAVYRIIEALLTIGASDISGYDSISRYILMVVAILGAIIEIFIVLFFANLIIRYLITRQSYFENLFNHVMSEYPIRRIFAVIFLSISFISFIMFKIIEKTSWLDALYYVIVTMSTVGFGDVLATQPSTKILTLFLIFNGITFIGLASQVLLDHIINLQLSKQLSLPSEPLDLENHIIIGGYGAKGRRLAQLFRERIYTVVVVELDEDRARLAEFNGFTVINGDITKPALLDILSLEKANGLFLLLSDDNLVIQTGIIARSIATDLDIYGEFLSVPTYNISRYAGINKPVSLFGFLTNTLQSYLSSGEIDLIQSLRELRQQETALGFIQIPIDFEYEGLFENPVIIGEVSRSQNEIYLEKDIAIEYEKPPLHSTHLLLAVDKDELDQKLKGQGKEHSGVGRLIFAGYSDLVETFIDRLEIAEEEIIVLWQNEEYEEILKQKNFKKYEWSLENGHLLLERMIKDHDVVICSFDDITSSLIVGVTLRNLEKETHLIQLAPYEYDIDPLIKVGADVVFTPQQILSNAMITIFLKENNISPSLVYTNGHIYEHLVSPGDFYDKKSEGELELENYNILYVRKSGEANFQNVNLKYKIKAGDRILVFIKNEKKERIDTLTKS